MPRNSSTVDESDFKRFSVGTSDEGLESLTEAIELLVPTELAGKPSADSVEQDQHDEVLAITVEAPVAEPGEPLPTFGKNYVRPV